MIYVCELEIVEKPDGCFEGMLFGADETIKASSTKQVLERAVALIQEEVTWDLLRGLWDTRFPLGNQPVAGGRVITVATDVTVDTIPMVTVGQAAAMLRMDPADIELLCDVHVLGLWSVGQTLVDRRSVEEVLSDSFFSPRTLSLIVSAARALFADEGLNRTVAEEWLGDVVAEWRRGERAGLRLDVIRREILDRMDGADLLEADISAGDRRGDLVAS
ncbi:hypothetical protein [Kribbibacterium absianum]|uniref:hypothetical protein n=1 Tax=Kribbibacterium absianum TaxID=3044210 RepID=UPI0024BD379B|nr:hypothetical protein [Olsenella sp. YH-ols2216]MDJ1121837.1 hypothetical protein [Olsenella sp. YH-ols2216]